MTAAELLVADEAARGAVLPAAGPIDPPATAAARGPRRTRR